MRAPEVCVELTSLVTLTPFSRSWSDLILQRRGYDARRTWGAPSWPDHTGPDAHQVPGRSAEAAGSRLAIRTLHCAWWATESQTLGGSRAVAPPPGADPKAIRIAYEGAKCSLATGEIEAVEISV